MSRLVVLAQTPPPRHGQSIMVERLVDLLRGERFRDVCEVELISLRLSASLDEIGGFSLRKVFRTFGYLLRLVRARISGPIDLLYYVPATGLRSQLYRDWILLGLGRRLAKRTVLHWHGLGLREFYGTELNAVERWLTRWTYRRHWRSLVVNPGHESEVAWLEPRSVATLANFLPDPCGATIAETLRARRGRRAQREACGAAGCDLRVVFLGHCTREKGLFDLLDGVALANRTLATEGRPWRVRLTVGGEFLEDTERMAFEKRIAEPDLRGERGKAMVEFAGYLDGETKDGVLSEGDALCLPTYFHTEAQPVVLIEALAYGMEVIVSDWRNLPAMLPDTAHVVPTRSPEAIAEALLKASAADSGEANRRWFMERYEQERVEISIFDF